MDELARRRIIERRRRAKQADAWRTVGRVVLTIAMLYGIIAFEIIGQM